LSSLVEEKGETEIKSPSKAKRASMFTQPENIEVCSTSEFKGCQAREKTRCFEGDCGGAALTTVPREGTRGPTKHLRPAPPTAGDSGLLWSLIPPPGSKWKAAPIILAS
jgi:hypothetical protein